jgi:four helix bundle protein
MADGPDRKYDLEDRLQEFAVLVCGIVEALPATRIGSHVASQLIRCGTSAPPNYAEAQSAESRRDFVHKMKVCLKELRETLVWLRFIRRVGLNGSSEVESGIRESNELISIFVKSIGTAQKNEGRKM